MAADLKLNWLGIHVADFDAALRFYTETLGLRASDTKPDWAYLETSGMVFELFGGGPARAQTQTIRPGIHVADLRATLAALRARGVPFDGQIRQADGSEWIEFSAPQGMRWTLVQAPGAPAGPEPGRAHIGRLELKTEQLAAQQAFYRDILGLQVESARDGQAVLKQEPDGPLLFLESAAGRPAPFQVHGNSLQPPPSHLLSCETRDIQAAAAWLKAQGVTLLTEIAHKDWGGIDLYISDPDGNPIQIVQYLQA